MNLKLNANSKCIGESNNHDKLNAIRRVTIDIFVTIQMKFSSMVYETISWKLTHPHQLACPFPLSVSFGTTNWSHTISTREEAVVHANLWLIFDPRVVVQKLAML